MSLPASWTRSHRSNVALGERPSRSPGGCPQMQYRRSRNVIVSRRDGCLPAANVTALHTAWFVTRQQRSLMSNDGHISTRDWATAPIPAKSGALRRSSCTQVIVMCHELIMRTSRSVIPSQIFLIPKFVSSKIPLLQHYPHYFIPVAHLINLTLVFTSTSSLPSHQPKYFISSTNSLPNHLPWTSSPSSSLNLAPLFSLNS